MAGGKPERLREPDHARPLLNMQKILNNILRGNRKPLKYFTEENKDKMCTLKKKNPTTYIHVLYVENGLKEYKNKQRPDGHSYNRPGKKG